VWCKYDTSRAVGCGVVAALLALTTQIVASAATGCCRSWGIPSEPKRIVAVVLSSEPKRIVAVVLSSFSWYVRVQWPQKEK
jgi:branched-subunit amino acid transport protein